MITDPHSTPPTPQTNDELCHCGAKKSAHDAAEHEAWGFVVAIPGHGPCPATNCAKFTWKSTEEGK